MSKTKVSYYGLQLTLEVNLFLSFYWIQSPYTLHLFMYSFTIVQLLPVHSLFKIASVLWIPEQIYLCCFEAHTIPLQNS